MNRESAKRNLDAEIRLLERRLLQLQNVRECLDDPAVAETVVKAFESNGSVSDKGGPKPLAARITDYFVATANAWATAVTVARAVNVKPSSARDVMGRSHTGQFEGKQVKPNEPKLFRLREHVYTLETL